MTLIDIIAQAPLDVISRVIGCAVAIMGASTILFIVGLEMIERRYRLPPPDLPADAQRSLRRTWEERSTQGQASALLPTTISNNGGRAG